MPNIISNKNLIVRNTFFLYFRSVIIMAVGIYTSRVVLQTLGVEDYGVYNVVAGFVGLFSILSSSLIHASQRFISFEMGKECPDLHKVFCGTVTIHVLLSFVIVIGFETFGLWFLNTHLNISENRLLIANWVYQCSVLTFCVNLISVPYNACIVAHEKMNVFAYISIYEVVAKLGIVYLLKLTDIDKLLLYAILMLLISISVRVIYGAYCKKRFIECHFKFFIDKRFLKSLLSFSGWNFIGSTAGILVTQGINMLINIFFGVALNAARGLAEQVNSAVNQFVANFMMALNPQITKSFAAGKYDYMNNLIIKGAKYATILYWYISLTIFIEVDFILDIWLVEVPPFTAVFLRLVIIYSIFQSLSNTLYIGMLATGNIKKYQIIMGSLYICSFLLCFILFKFGLGPEWGYLSTIIAVFLGLFARLYLLNQMIPKFSIKKYVEGAISKSAIVILLSTLVVYVISIFFSGNEVLEFFVVLCSTIVFLPIITYFFSLDGQEKMYLKNGLVKVFKCVINRLNG